MPRRKGLTPEQVQRVNRTLRHIASELERRNAVRAAAARERTDKLADVVMQRCQELVDA